MALANAARRRSLTNRSRARVTIGWNPACSRTWKSAAPRRHGSWLAEGTSSIGVLPASGRNAAQSASVCGPPSVQVKAPGTFVVEKAIDPRSFTSIPGSLRCSSSRASLRSPGVRLSTAMARRGGRWYAALPIACAFAACRTKKKDIARSDSFVPRPLQKLAEEHFHGGAQSEQPRQALRGAEEGDEGIVAQLRHVEVRIVAVARDPVIAGQRQLEAAAVAVALDGGDRRHRRGSQALVAATQGVRALHRCALRVRGGREQEAHSVDEAAWLRALEHHRARPGGEAGLKLPLQLEGHRGREHVDRRSSGVEREVENPAAKRSRAACGHRLSARKRASDATVSSAGSSTLAIHSGRNTGRPSSFSRSMVSSTTLSESSPRSARMEASGVIRLRSFFGTSVSSASRTSGNSSGSCRRERVRVFTSPGPRGRSAAGTSVIVEPEHWGCKGIMDDGMRGCRCRTHVCAPRGWSYDAFPAGNAGARARENGRTKYVCPTYRIHDSCSSEGWIFPACCAWKRGNSDQCSPGLRWWTV